MLIKQISCLIFFIYWVMAHTYLVLTPAVLFSSNKWIIEMKKLVQTFSTDLLIRPFKTTFYLAQSKQNIIKTINENPNLIDVLFCNHVSTLDFLFVVAYLQHFKIDSYNFVLKKQIIYYPCVGFVMYADSDIKLNRNWNQDKTIINKQLDDIKLTNTKQIILIFPEGTRLTSEKLIAAQKFSKENNLPIFNNLQVPKTKGLWSIVSHLKKTNRLGKIWDITLVMPQYIRKSAYITDILGKPIGSVYGIIRHVKLPDDVYDLDIFRKWLLEIWQEKDNFIQTYKNFKYDKLNLDMTNNSHVIEILFICFIMTILLSRKYGRAYLIIMIVISYILILTNSNKKN